MIGLKQVLQPQIFHCRKLRGQSKVYKGKTWIQFPGKYRIVCVEYCCPLTDSRQPTVPYYPFNWQDIRKIPSFRASIIAWSLMAYSPSMNLFLRYSISTNPRTIQSTNLLNHLQCLQVLHPLAEIDPGLFADRIYANLSTIFLISCQLNG